MFKAFRRTFHVSSAAPELILDIPCVVSFALAISTCSAFVANPS